MVRLPFGPRSTSFFSFTLSFAPSDTTPIFPSVRSAEAPPLISSLSPSFLLISAPESPPKFSPFPIVVLMFVISLAFFVIFVLLVFTPSLTVFSWSSVAACPCTTVGLSISQVVFVRPFTVPASPFTVTGWVCPTVTTFPSPMVYSLPPVSALVPFVTVTLASFALTVVAFAVPPMAAFS